MGRSTFGVAQSAQLQACETVCLDVSGPQLPQDPSADIDGSSCRHTTAQTEQRQGAFPPTLEWMKVMVVHSWNMMSRTASLSMPPG